MVGDLFLGFLLEVRSLMGWFNLMGIINGCDGMRVLSCGSVV